MNDTGNGIDWTSFCQLDISHVLFWTISILLLLSLFLNFFCCMSKLCPGKLTCQQERRQRRAHRQMEENPIYGNLGYMQTNTATYTDVTLQRVTSDPQSKSQDCYANLTLKSARQQPGCSSSQIHFSEEVLQEEPLELEKDDEPCTDTVSTLSDLYASVQTQRTKTIQPADSGEEYANHL